MPVISRYSKIDTRFSILASVPYRVHQLLQWVYPCDYDEFSRITRFTSTSSYFCRVFIRLALKRIMLPRILLVESCEGAHNVRLRGLVVKLQWIDAELQATYFAGGEWTALIIVFCILGLPTHWVNSIMAPLFGGFRNSAETSRWYSIQQ